MGDQGIDKILLFVVVALTLVGLVMVYSSSYTKALEATGARDASLFLRKHLVRVMLGALLLYLCVRAGERNLRKLAPYALVGSLALLVLVLLPTPLQHSVRGAARWLKVGPLVFQPSEVAKIGLVMYLADFIARKGGEIRSFTRGFLPAVVVVALVAGLVGMEPNLGTASMLMMIGLAVLLVGGARLVHVGGCVAACLITVLGVMKHTGYNWERILTFLGRGAEAISYHVHQSLVAIGVGGIGGVGIGMSNQKYFFVPDAHTDFVFSIIAEEVGFVGVMVIMGLFMVFVWRGLRAAHRARTVFSSVLATGVTLAIAGYFCVSTAVCTGLLPTMGLPMPFMSYGGTSSMILLGSCGILLGVSRRRSTYLDIQPERWKGMIR
jgi:cell division protein FtsW